MFLRTCTRAHTAVHAVAEAARDALADRVAPGVAHGVGHDDRGQSTAEYGLVILAAGGIALGVIAWAGKTGTFTGLFESVVKKLSKGL